MPKIHKYGEITFENAGEFNRYWDIAGRGSQQYELISGYLRKKGDYRLWQVRAVNYLTHILEGYLADKKYINTDLVYPNIFYDKNAHISEYSQYLYDYPLDIFGPEIIVLKNQSEIVSGSGCFVDFIISVEKHEFLENGFSKRLSVYLERGVREYWIVDYWKRQITIYHNINSSFNSIENKFDGNIPVNIYPDLIINFTELKRRLENLPDCYCEDEKYEKLYKRAGQGL